MAFASFSRALRAMPIFFALGPHTFHAERATEPCTFEGSMQSDLSVHTQPTHSPGHASRRRACRGSRDRRGSARRTHKPGTPAHCSTAEKPPLPLPPRRLLRFPRSSAAAAGSSTRVLPRFPCCLSCSRLFGSSWRLPFWRWLDLAVRRRRLMCCGR